MPDSPILDQVAPIAELFKTGVTYDYNFRLQQLHQLKKSLKQHEAELTVALKTDLNKPAIEAYSSEIGFVYSEINHACNNLKAWMQPKKVASPLSLFYSTSYIYPEPLGLCLIIAPWNYPVQLLLSPLIGAIAAGNCVVLKPSEFTPNVAVVLGKIITQAFKANYILLINGDGAQIVPELIKGADFKHVFFTGSSSVGKIIAGLCSTKLIPYTLELGGKSPAIVDGTAKLPVICRRIAWAKFYNGGQTCVAPDYVVVDRAIKHEFIAELKQALSQIYPAGTEALYRIVNLKRFDTLINYLTDAAIIYGGKHIRDELYIEPTVIDAPGLDSPVMREEIFGPILPVLSYSNTEELYQIIRHNPNPLALYVFSENDSFTRQIIHDIQFGGGGINIALLHLVNPNLPFGGVMTSGQGAYHGKFSFDTFSHKKSIVKMSTSFDAFIKYPPYTKLKTWLLKKFSGS